MNTQELIIVEVFCKECQIEVNLIQDFEDYGLIEIIVKEEQRYIDRNQLATLEKIIRLHNELNINKEGIDIILNLQEKENRLLTEIKYLKDRLGLYE